MRRPWCWPAAAPVVPALATAFGIPCRLAGRRASRSPSTTGRIREGTPAVLDAARRGRRRATFYLVGEQVERCPALAPGSRRRPRIGIHGYRHTLLLRRTTAALARRPGRARGRDRRGDGARARSYRPPYGVFSLAALRSSRARGAAALVALGPGLGGRATPASIAARATRDSAPGDVVLLHDGDAVQRPRLVAADGGGAAGGARRRRSRAASRSSR